jgi:hypothetical protein
MPRKLLMKFEEVERLQQGHLYTHIFTGRKVLALSNGLTAEALILDMREPTGYSGKMLIQAAHVVAEPMIYFGGRKP